MSTYENMMSFIKSAWPARKFIVPCLVGPPGIGKTMACKQAAQELTDSGQGCTGKVVTIIASQILPNEVSGITMPVVEQKSMEIFDHFRLSSMQDGDILFFDELLEADQLVLSACLTLIESRELMSGRKLPDIMIVAATNNTIKPNMLKENIRQRFVWRDFGIDGDGTKDYIMREFGIDIGDLVSELVSSGTEYNILTPRSLTKMCAWIATAESKGQAKYIGKQIDAVWNSELGSKLAEKYIDVYFGSKLDEIRKIVGKVYDEKVAANSDLISGSDFSNATMEELLDVINEYGLDKELGNIFLDDEDDDVNF